MERPYKLRVSTHQVRRFERIKTVHPSADGLSRQRTQSGGPGFSLRALRTLRLCVKSAFLSRDWFTPPDGSGSNPTLVGGLPPAPTDRLGTSAHSPCIFRLTNSESYDSLQQWSFCGLNVVGKRRLVNRREGGRECFGQAGRPEAKNKQK